MNLGLQDAISRRKYIRATDTKPLSNADPILRGLATMQDVRALEMPVIIQAHSVSHRREVSRKGVLLAPGRCRRLEDSLLLRRGHRRREVS